MAAGHNHDHGPEGRDHWLMLVLAALLVLVMVLGLIFIRRHEQPRRRDRAATAPQYDHGDRAGRSMNQSGAFCNTKNIAKLAAYGSR